MLIKQQKKDMQHWKTLVALKIYLNLFIEINMSAWKNEEYGKQVAINNV